MSSLCFSIKERRQIMGIFRYTIILIILLVMSIPQALAQEEKECLVYQEIAEALVPPEVGDSDFIKKLVSVPDGQDFLAQFPNVCQLPDELRKVAPNLGYCKTETLTLRYNKNKGELKFVDRNQLFNLEKSKQKAVSEQEGLRAIIPFFTVIGNIFTEANFATYSTNVLMGAGGFKEETQPSFRFEAERHYRIGRVINGVPVEESKFFAAVSNEAKVSKFRLRWPQFKIAPVVKETAEPISREQVVRDVYRELVERSPTCEKLSKYQAYIAYVPMAMDKVEDKDNVLYEESQIIMYTPQLVVTILPASENESGEEFVVEILVAGTDDDGGRDVNIVVPIFPDFKPIVPVLPERIK